MKKSIAQVVVGLPVEGPFDYAVPTALQKRIAQGMRVKVMFNRRKRAGYVTNFIDKSSFSELNSILDVLDHTPTFTSYMLSLAEAFSEFYGCSKGEALDTFLPIALRKTQSLDDFDCHPSKQENRGTSSSILIHDISKEKRWEVVRKNVEKVIEEDRKVIFLVPEHKQAKIVKEKLKLSSQIRIACVHKKLTQKKERELWTVLRAGRYDVVIGTRSSVFAPLDSLGLIVVYDEENPSYKQEQSPHYHVREVALMRQKIEKCALMFVSAAPTAEIWKESQENTWKRTFLSDDNACVVQTIDMTNYNPQRSSILSFPLQNQVQKFLEQKKKVLIFLNRRGFYTMTRCPDCGWMLKCDRCDTGLTFLFSQDKLICRRCQSEKKHPNVCPSCKSRYLRSSGIGVEKLEGDASRYFREAVIKRYDADSKIFPKSADIVIATQAIMKEKESQRFSLCAVLDIDAELHRLDYRSNQKALSLLSHIYQMTDECLMVQTRMADSSCLKAIRKQDFTLFYNDELALRKELKLPPYVCLIALNLRASQEDDLIDQSDRLFELLRQASIENAEILEPQPDFVPKLRDKYRYHIMIKTTEPDRVLKSIKQVVKSLRKKRDTIITIDVNP